jgi:hypothetical protein
MVGTQIENVGIGGRTTQQLIDEFPTKVHAKFYRPGAQVVFFEYINSSADAATEDTLIRSYVSQAKGLGWFVWVCTAPNSADSSAAKLLTVNAALRSDHSFADGFIDYAAAPELDPPGSGANPTYYADSKHLTQAGYAVLAALAVAALTA